VLAIRPQSGLFGLGAAEQKLYREVGDCGVVQGGSFWPFDGSSGRPCKLWTASEIPLKAGDRVYAVDLGREITYYPSPSSVVDKLGRCGAIQAAYTTGFLVPGAMGTEQIEPGVFHPSKSWQEMADESRKLRAGDPSVQTGFAFCGENPIGPGDWATQVRPPTNLGDSWSWNLTLRNPDGSTRCESPEVHQAEGIIVSWTARLPQQYQATLPILRTAAMWLASDSDSWSGQHGGPYVEQVICGSRPVAGTGTRWGHSYTTTSLDVVQIGPSGAGARASRVIEGPILQVQVNPNAGPAKQIAGTWVGIWSYVAGGPLASAAGVLTVSALIDAATEGQWINLTPAQVDHAISTGQWPLPGTLGARWKDTGQPLDPSTLTAAPAGPAQASSGSVALGLAGLAVGVILLVMAGRERKTS
jgi:hypothetical protein